MTGDRTDSFEKLRQIIKTLRSPEGCAWDRKQTREDVVKYLLAEVYEVVDAIEEGSAGGLREELGDTLFQILFLAGIAEEAGEFDIYDVINDITAKMIRRHPHVFGNRKVSGIPEIKANWEEIKRGEKPEQEEKRSLLSGIPRSLPPLIMAREVTARASKVGFDWENMQDVLVKVGEELEELRSSVKSNDQEKIAEEVGDIFFSLVNLCRFIDKDPDTLVRASVRKFTERFAYIEKRLAKRDLSPADVSLEEMDYLWECAKKEKEGS